MGVSKAIIHPDENREKLLGQEERQKGSAVYKEVVGEAQNEQQEGQIQAEEHQKWGIKSAQ